jgi:hypothetical protein
MHFSNIYAGRFLICTFLIMPQIGFEIAGCQLFTGVAICHPFPEVIQLLVNGTQDGA